MGQCTGCPVVHSLVLKNAYVLGFPWCPSGWHSVYAQCRGLSLILGQGSRSYMLQQRLKMLFATTKTWYGQ